MHKQKVIVGLGQTGQSCARYLSDRQESFIAVDSRINPPGFEEFQNSFPEAKTELGEFKVETLLEAQELILSPGVDMRHPAIRQAVAAGIPVTGDINIFAHSVTAPIVAVTGSNAKSTVVTLLGEMAVKAGLTVAVAGNIGKPVLDLLKEPVCDLYVLELSSFQLETTSKLGAKVATILNISPDHLDRYDSMAAYVEAKQRIFQGSKHIVINRNDPETFPARMSDSTVSSFGYDSDSALTDDSVFSVNAKNGERFLAMGNMLLLPVSEMKMSGGHNVLNALAALAVGKAAGIPMSAMLQTLREFAGLPHRCQWVAESNGVSYYNDSKGTNIGACIAAIEGLAKAGEAPAIILLAGGVGKGADFTKLIPALKASTRLVILFGEDAQEIQLAIQGVVATEQVDSLQDAVRLAQNKAVHGDRILLSPACASFDMFANYQERGAAFIQAVKELH